MTPVIRLRPGRGLLVMLLFTMFDIEAPFLCSGTDSMTNPSVSSAQQCSDALQQLKLALELLDKAEAPAAIGAHLDLAINRLEAHLDESLAA